jgi:thiol-disulfide isomerase/thioredoxin
MRLLLTLALWAAVLPAQVPRPAGELTWTGHNGTAGSLAKHKGKIVVLEILSTTCPHCQEAAANLAKVAQEYADKGVQVQGVAINDDADPADFIRRFKLNFPVGKGQQDQAYAFLQHSVMRPFYLPGLVFVDRNGVIQAQHKGADPFIENNQLQNVRRQLDKMLGTSAAPAKTSTGAKPAGKAL